MELPGVTCYVWANSMEKAIIALAQGKHFSSRIEAIKRAREVEDRLGAGSYISRTLWEIIIRREDDAKI